MPLLVLAEQPLLPQLPRRRQALAAAGCHDVAGAEVAARVGVAAEPDPRAQLAVEMGLACERQQPVAVAGPLESLGVEGEGAVVVLAVPGALHGEEDGAAVGVHGVGGEAEGVERRRREHGTPRPQLPARRGRGSEQLEVARAPVRLDALGSRNR